MWYLILTLITAIYLAINIALPKLVSGSTNSYILQPILWITLAIIAFLLARKEGINIIKYKKIRRWQLGKAPYQSGLLIGGFQIALLIIIGLIFGFGRSPNIITPSTFFIFLIYIITPIVGMELSRTYLLKKGSSPKKNITLQILLISLLYMIIQIKFTDFTTLDIQKPAMILQLVGETIIPLLTMSLFATYLAYYGGAIASISYLATVKIFEMYSPILPDVDWMIKAFVGILAPTVGFLLIQASIQEISLPRKLSKKKDPTLGWVALAVVCLVLVLFSYGYFGVEPTAISSGSMRPTIETGDVVLIDEISINDIQKGDVIQYDMDGIPTVHRVYDIKQTEEKNLVFITKGDANNAPDVDPVKPEQIQGKAVFTIPKLGWIPLAIKMLANRIGFAI
jgi:signal peptidase